MSKYGIRLTTQFKKDVRLAEKSHKDIGLLRDVVKKLANGEKLDKRFKDHALAGNWKNYRECHLQPDWLLVYRYEKNLLILTLARTGTHSEILGK